MYRDENRNGNLSKSSKQNTNYYTSRNNAVTVRYKNKKQNKKKLKQIKQQQYLIYKRKRKRNAKQTKAQTS